jgi:hypothetical protein
VEENRERVFVWTIAPVALVATIAVSSGTAGAAGARAAAGATAVSTKHADQLGTVLATSTITTSASSSSGYSDKY